MSALLVGLMTTSCASAQRTGPTRPQEFETFETLEWNLGGTREPGNVALKDPSAYELIDPIVYQKPAKDSIELVLVQPKKLKFKTRYGTLRFLGAAHALGLQDCPPWVAIQKYMNGMGDFKEPIYFYQGSGKPVLCVGPNPDGTVDVVHKRHDMYVVVPNGDPRVHWAFMRAK